MWGMRLAKSYSTPLTFTGLRWLIGSPHEQGERVDYVAGITSLCWLMGKLFKGRRGEGHEKVN
jgi:hypothetical protein